MLREKQAELSVSQDDEYSRVGVRLDTAGPSPSEAGQPPDAPHPSQELHQLLLAHVAQDVL